MATLAFGLVVGVVNAALVLALRIPAIIATLATGYVLATAAFSPTAPGQLRRQPDAQMAGDGARRRLPVIAIIAVAAAVAPASCWSARLWPHALGVGQNAARPISPGSASTRIVAPPS